MLLGGEGCNVLIGGRGNNTMDGEPGDNVVLNGFNTGPVPPSTATGRTG